jgi:hypothetical protein
VDAVGACGQLLVGSAAAATVTGMTKPPLADVPVRTAEELTQRWERLLDPPVFSARSLWLTWLDDGFLLPVVIPVDDIPARPDRQVLADLVNVCEAIAESHVAGECHIALALCRPGRPSVSVDDESWATGLRSAFASSDATWSLHLAAGGSIVPMVAMPE